MKEARYTGIGLKSLCILTLRRVPLDPAGSVARCSADGDLRRGELFRAAGRRI